MISAFTFFIPSSPRWLLSKDREEEAVVSLRRLRTKADAFEGRCDAEVQEIKEALRGNVQKAPWADLIHGNNLRRTMIVVVYYFFQQVRLLSVLIPQTKKERLTAHVISRPRVKHLSQRTRRHFINKMVMLTSLLPTLSSTAVLA